jgi:hypothetical protein
VKRTAKIVIVVFGLGAAGAALASQLGTDTLLRPTLRLEANGPDTLINCPWEKKLTIRLSKKAPAAVVKCIDGGPGIELDFRGL